MRGRARWIVVGGIAAALLSSAACSVLFDGESLRADAGASDAAAGDASDADAADASAACDRSKPFGTPRPITELNTSVAELSLQLSSDELIAYVTSERDAGFQSINSIFVATRSGRDAGFGPLQLLGGINQAATINRDPSVTGDGNFLLFITERPPDGGTGFDVYSATRGNPANDFGGAGRVSELSSPSTELHPFVLPDGLTVYFTSTRNGGYDIFRSARPSRSSPFSTPVAIEVNDSSFDGSPVLTPDELTLYFYSIRGAGDVWVSRRNAKSEPWPSPTHVAELDSTAVDYPVWVSADDCRIYLVSQRAGGAGSSDLWFAERP